MKIKDLSLVNKLRRKSLIDCISILFFAIITALAVAFRGNSVLLLLLILFFTTIYILQYTYSRNDVIRALKSTIDSGLRESEETTSKALELNTKQKNIADSYTDTVKKIDQSIRSVSQISSKTKDFAQNVAAMAQESLSFSFKESQSVKENISMMLTLKQKIQTIAELILELSDYIQQIGNTVGIVEDIAEQTNMLALNAAVEAARAGEHGKGFAVVAGEIRKLADESKQATTKISSLINDIEQATNSTVMATEEGTKEIESGVELAHNINGNIDSLINIMKDLTTGIEEILSSTIDQSMLSENVIDSVDELHKKLEESTQTLNENTENIRIISQLSSHLKDNIIS
ncbi:MAG: methyl-accepting chemotaxis protein [Candidatus Gastranaerophilales bacterium]|nr:methyl-accepting chemotaxis protein [Candidatus Gastranaerophilales bacterium]